MDKSAFLDTSYIIALVNKDDDHHKKALTFSKEVDANKINIVTTEFILVEIADSLSKLKFRNECIITLQKIRRDTFVFELSKEKVQKAWSLYEKMLDKEWGFTDCYSFVVMKELDIRQALSTDKHFEQAGFEILLKLTQRLDAPTGRLYT